MAVELAGPSTYLDLYLGPLSRILDTPEVTDVYVNRPDEAWVETLGGQIERHVIAELSEAFLWRLARQIAHWSHQGVSRRHPLLSATLPDGTRVQIVAPPATRGPMALAFRRHAARTPDLSSYGLPHSSPADGALGKGPEGERPALANHATFLREAVRRRRNIVISGGTSSGKTTLLNALMAQIPAEERIIVIEDTPELRLSHQNAVGMVAVRGGEGEAMVTALDLLQASLRMRPDRILLGELRGPEAFTFLRAINTGHPGSMTTVHADSPERALAQLAMMALQAGMGIAYGELRTLVREMVDVVVQVERDGAHRQIHRVELAR